MNAELIEFEPHEDAALDVTRIGILRASLGDQRCREVIEEVIYHLSDRLTLLQTALYDGNTAEVLTLASRLAALSEQVGLGDFARVARDLGVCIRAEDAIATAAVGERLIRLGEESLFCVMRYADHSAL